MPSFSKTILAVLLASSAVLALPTPQIAGEGAASDSIFTELDNGLGYGVEDALDNIAGNINQVKGQTNSAGTTTGGGSSGAPPPPPGKRQLNKIAAGLQTVSEALGTGSSTEYLNNDILSNDIDGGLTDGAANIGAAIGNVETSSLEGAGSSVPKKL